MMTLSLKNRRGFTMLEMLVATTILTLLMASIVSMWMATARRCETELAQVDTDTNAVLAMQSMVTDVREAKSVTILASGAQLSITKPIRAQQGYYDRSQGDTNHQINYYLSDSTGIVGRTGTYLWRSQDTAARCIRKNVDALLFETDVPRSIQITIESRDAVSHEAMKKNVDTVGVYTQLTDRVVYLRNY
jgi:prepilin-type N-terminal cleavage/methylation domain-containing protein